MVFSVSADSTVVMVRDPAGTAHDPQTLVATARTGHTCVKVRLQGEDPSGTFRAPPATDRRQGEQTT